MSPGPSFVVIARRAVATTRSDGIAAALGMGLASAIFASSALLGLHILLTNVPWLYLGLKVIGGAYLMYLAIRLWHGAGAPLEIAETSIRRQSDLGKSFVLGLITQLSNPKTAIVYASVFSVLLPSGAPSWFGALLLPLIFSMEAGWYTIVAMVLSADGPRRGYVTLKPWIDRLAGGVMGLFGLTLVSDTH